jgi:hypothetical protein
MALLCSPHRVEYFIKKKKKKKLGKSKPKAKQKMESGTGPTSSMMSPHDPRFHLERRRPWGRTTPRTTVGRAHAHLIIIIIIIVVVAVDQVAEGGRRT